MSKSSSNITPEMLHARILQIMSYLNIEYFPSATMIRKYPDGGKIIKYIYKIGNMETVANEMGLMNISNYDVVKRNFIGKRFGRLVVVGYSSTDKNGDSKWQCLCDCGNQKIVSRHSLVSGATKSCGCFNKEIIASMKHTWNTKHGLSSHPLYLSWLRMKGRCYYSGNKNYNNYGGRGIEVCGEWKKDFLNFYNWAINNGWKTGLTLDRIDVNGNYSPDNCRWETNDKQQRNKRNTVYVNYNDMKISMQDLCEMKNINAEKLYYLINKGVDINSAIQKLEV